MAAPIPSGKSASGRSIFRCSWKFAVPVLRLYYFITDRFYYLKNIFNNEFLSFVQSRSSAVPAAFLLLLLLSIPLHLPCARAVYSAACASYFLLNPVSHQNLGKRNPPSPHTEAVSAHRPRTRLGGSRQVVSVGGKGRKPRPVNGLLLQSPN